MKQGSLAGRLRHEAGSSGDLLERLGTTGQGQEEGRGQGEEALRTEQLPEEPSSKDRLLEVSAQLPFGHAVGFLVSQLGAAVTRSFKAALEGIDLEPRHFGLMRAIYTNGRLSQQALGEILQIPASSLVALLDHLETAGLVKRGLDSSDRRVRLVELTGSGQTALVQAVEIGVGIETGMCRGLAPDERELLIANLQRVARNMGLTLGVHPGFDDQVQSGRRDGGPCRSS